MLAEELAEMLSVDMQKEGLCGRTLTLKLKTASFEVLLMFRFCSNSHVFLRLIRSVSFAIQLVKLSVTFEEPYF